MAEDIASLGFRVESQQVATADRRLGSLATRGREVESSVSGVNKSFRMLRSALIAVGGIAVFSKMKSEIGGFQQTMSGVQAVTQATSEQMAEMETTARQLGATTLFSAQEAAEGMRFLGMAGFEVNEIIAAMPAVLNLATAGMMDLGTTADIVSNIMQPFNLRAEEAGRVADVLAKTQASANTSVEQLGEAMSFAAPFAASFGISLEETAAAIGTLSDAGVQGSRAGTGFARVLAVLAQGSSKTENVLGDFGITLEDVNPRVKSLEEIVAALTPVVEAGGEALDIFGQRGGPAIINLVRGGEGLKDLQQNIDDAGGSAQEMADVMADNIPGASKALGSAVSELVLVVGEQGLAGAIRESLNSMTLMVRAMAGVEEGVESAEGVTRGLIDSIQFIREHSEAYGAVAKGLAIIIGANLSGAMLTAAFSTARASIENARYQATLARMAGASYAATTAITVLNSALRLMGGPVGLVLAAAAALYTFSRDSGVASSSVEDLNRQTEALLGNMEKVRELELEDAIAKNEEQARKLGERYAELSPRVENARYTLEKLEGQQGRTARFSRESAQETIAEFERVSEQLEKTGENTVRLRQRLIGLISVNGEVVEATDMATEAMERHRLEQMQGNDAAGESNRKKKEQQEAIDEVVGSLRHEIAQLQRSAEQQDVHNALREAGISADHEAAAAISDLVRQLRQQEEAQDNLNRMERDAARIRQQVRAPGEIYEEQMAKLRELQDLHVATHGQMGIDLETYAQAAEEAWARYKGAGEEATSDMGKAINGWANRMSSDLAEIATDSEKTFDDILDSFKKMIIQMIIQKQIVEPFLSSFGGGNDTSGGTTTTEARGGVYNRSGRVDRYASGGVVSRPTLFAHASGMGVMGEGNRPEAVMPLERGPSGQLGVRAEGGSGQVIVNIHAEGAEEEDVEVQESENANGDVQIDAFIRSSVRRGVRDGSFDKEFKQSFGLSRRGARR